MIFVPSISRNERIRAGCPGHAGALVRLPSVEALEKDLFGSTHLAPALLTSGLMAGYAVSLRPSNTPAAARICGPWHRVPSGLFAFEKWRTISSTLLLSLRYSGALPP